MNGLYITSLPVWNAEASAMCDAPPEGASTSYVTQSERLPAQTLPKSTYDFITSVSHKSGVHTITFLAETLSSLVPGGRFKAIERVQQVSFFASQVFISARRYTASARRLVLGLRYSSARRFFESSTPAQVERSDFERALLLAGFTNCRVVRGEGDCIVVRPFKSNSHLVTASEKRHLLSY